MSRPFLRYRDYRGAQESPGLQLQRLLERLSQPFRDTGPVRDWLAELRQLLDCLLLGTGEYRMAQARIANAERYLASEERGATRYELQMLISGLQSHLPPPRTSSMVSPMPSSLEPGRSVSACALDASRTPRG